MCEKYNGWTNRETWLVNVWGFTDYDTDELEVYRGNPYALGKDIEARIEEFIPELGGIMGDMLSGALARVDYYDLAETLLQDLPDSEDD